MKTCFLRKSSIPRFIFNTGALFFLMNGYTPDAGAADVIGPDGISYPDFTRAGIPGGIPDVNVVIDVTTLGATPNDGKDDSAAIQAAVYAVAAQGGGAVFLPAGEYHIDRTVTINRDNVVIRGEDPEKTVIRPRFRDENHPAGWTFRFEGVAHPRRVDLNMTRPVTRGDTVLHVNGTGRLEVGDVVTIVARPPAEAIELLTEKLAGIATDGSYGSIYSWQYVRVTGLGDNEIHVDRPARLDLSLEQRPQVLMHNRLLKGAGIENLTIEQEVETRGINGVRFYATERNWMRGVTIRRIGNTPVNWVRSFEFEVRGCTLDDMRSRGGAVGYFGINFSSDGLVEDCDIRRLRHLSISMASNGIVLHRCRLSNVDINFHMHWPNGNLVDNCDVDATTEADDGATRGTYNWGIYTPRHTGDMHNPAGPHNTFFNSRYTSAKDGIMLGGGATRHTLITYNHFVSRGGSAAILQEGSDDTVLIGNNFVLDNPGETAGGTQWRVPSRTVEELVGGIILAAEIPGLRIIGNTFTGIPEDQILLHGEAAEKRDNTVSDIPPDATRPFAPSLLEWQRERKSR